MGISRIQPHEIHEGARLVPERRTPAVRFFNYLRWSKNLAWLRSGPAYIFTAVSLLWIMRLVVAPTTYHALIDRNPYREHRWSWGYWSKYHWHGVKGEEASRNRVMAPFMLMGSDPTSALLRTGSTNLSTADVRDGLEIHSYNIKWTSWWIPFVTYHWSKMTPTFTKNGEHVPAPPGSVIR